ncbi:MAG TPA: transketolase C-terminal domain-containing protein [Saprospiraceae bacterium]|nr:transketolase C-terminal domain-containing protein [Saprospiraceae bacterium]
MRTSFINQLIIEARNNPLIFLLTGDLGFSVLEPFENEFPNRYMNVGVAEQNMTGIAAGLAIEGFKVFTYSIANFPTLRCLEQIRNDVCYHNLDVTVVAVGGGFSYGALGASHHATEDIGILRTIPNFRIYAPGDPIETELTVQHLVKHKGPAYIRLGKAGEPVINKSNLSLESITCNCIKKGTQTAILTTGSILNYVYDSVLNTEFSLFSIPLIKPIDQNSILKIAQNHSNIITIEEHQRSSGFGSLILETLNDLFENGLISSLPKVKRIAIPDSFYYFAGSQDFLREEAGLKFIR